MRSRYLVIIILIFAFAWVFNSCIIIDRTLDLSSETMVSEDSDGEAPGKEEAVPGGNEEPDQLEEAPDHEHSDEIRVTTPSPGQLVTSPLTIEGEARGTWFFEATFPVRLLDGNGETIAEHYASTEQEWMTGDFISFSAVLEFEIPDTPTGTLILQKDNPSDMRELDAQIEVPVRFE